MIFRRQQGKDTELPSVPADMTLKVVIWHEVGNSRFFFEEDLGQTKSREILKELKHSLQHTNGAGQARIYRHYVELSWYNDTNAEEVEEVVLSILRRHFKWPAEPEKIDIMSPSALRREDHHYHGQESKWVLGQDFYL